MKVLFVICNTLLQRLSFSDLFPKTIIIIYVVGQKSWLLSVTLRYITCLLQPHLFVIDGEGHSSTGTVQDTQSVMSFHSSISSHSSRPSHHYKDALSRDAARAANQASQAAVEAHAAPIALQPLTGNQPLGSKVTVTDRSKAFIFYSFY